jgi:hypothetical protein
MSRVAQAWLRRQVVEDPTVRSVLAALARASNAKGECDLTQQKIAEASGLKERATRNALSLLDRFGVITREKRGAWKQAGRASDVILIALDRDFTISKGDISMARDAASPSDVMPVNAMGEPARDAASPSGSHIMKSIYGNDGAEIHRCVGRVWWDSSRQNWRAIFTLDGVDLDLGRHEAKDLAEAEIRLSIRDVEYTAVHRSGSPVDPVLDPSLQKLEGKALGDFVFGSDQDRWQEATRAAGRRGSGGSSPGQGCGDEVPASRSEQREVSR